MRTQKKNTMVICLAILFLLLSGCEHFSEDFNAGYEDAIGDSENENVEEEPMQAESSTDYQQGEQLGESLIDEMEGIDWEENYEKAEEAGKEAAEFLNGLLSGEE